MDRLRFSSEPSSSSTHSPASSLILARRILGMTSNSRASVPMTGSRIRSGGNVNFIRREAIIRLPSGNRRHQGNFVPIFKHGVLALKRADVLPVDIHVHESAQLARVIAKAVANSRVRAGEQVHHLSDAAGTHLHQIGVAGKLLKRS